MVAAAVAAAVAGVVVRRRGGGGGGGADAAVVVAVEVAVAQYNAYVFWVPRGPFLLEDVHISAWDEACDMPGWAPSTV